jgi:pyruvate dehydrogenase E1 component alpha subunit
MAELTGREAGISRGKGGSMHMFSTRTNSMAATASWARRCRWARVWLSRTSITRMAACALPISAMARPTRARSTSFNMAALWKLPIIFVVENNQYAMGTAVKRSSAETHFHRRGAAFTIPGMDERHGRAGSARGGQSGGGTCARGHGPVLMELNTYRYRGHSMSDPAKYRSREEVQDVREHRDPSSTPRKICWNAASPRKS